jgi:phosphonate ABC transporter permease subunit PhnE
MFSQNPPNSRSALRRLMVVSGIIVGFAIYAYGFKITDIGLEKTQDPTRQSAVNRAMRELLSPDIFDQDTTVEDASASFQKICSDSKVEQPAHEEGKPYVEVTPACGDRNDVVTVEGFNFPINSTGRVFLIRPSGERQPFDLVNDVGNKAFDIDGHGHFTTQVVLPALRGDPGSLHEIQVETEIPVGLPYLSGTSMIVIEKMVETVFLALMATTLALPVSVFVSFLAARNLMKEIQIPLGNILIGFILLPIGWIISSATLGALGKWGVELGKGPLMGVMGSGVAVIGFAVVTRTAGGINFERNSIERRVRDIIVSILLMALIIFTVGAIGGLGIWIGQQFKDGLVGILANMLGKIGLLIELVIVPLAGLAGASYLSSLGMSLTTPVLKGIRGIPSHVAAGILGAISGGLLMAGIGQIARTAALLTIIAPVVAAVIGGAALVWMYQWRFEPGHVRRSKRALAVMLVGSIITFVVTAHLLDVLHFIVIGRLPSQDFVNLAAVIGVVLGGLGGTLVGVNSSFPVGDVVYNVTRTILNALRSIEPLIMGIVFVIWVSIGPFAGVLALTLHSIASLGKLYSEQIESIDLGPIEAIQSTGANRLQTIVYAVVPQIVPPYISFTMYRWDINVRMSTIIGFVGGGGIGFLLQQQINLLRYDQAGVAVLAIAVVVSVLDYASASLRERVV